MSTQIRNENVIKALLYKTVDVQTRKLLRTSLVYINSDSNLFLSEIFKIIKNNDISLWARGEVAESLFKLDLPNNDGISEILRYVICHKSINSRTKSNVAKHIFTFRKDKKFIQEIIEIINNESISSWVRGGLVSAISRLNRVEHIDMVLDFILSKKENLLVQKDISRDIFNYLFQFEECNTRVISCIIEAVKDTTNIDIRLSWALSNIKYLNKKIIKKLVNMLEDEKLNKYLKLSIAESMIKLHILDNSFLVILKALINNKDTKFSDVRHLFELLLSIEKVDKEYQKVIDTLRSKRPKYMRVNGRLMKSSVYWVKIARGIRF